VTLAFHGSGATNPTAVTDAQGDYSITGVPQGTYAKLVAQGHGYLARHGVAVGPGTTDADFAPRFNWAGPGTGSWVVKATGKDYSSIGCGPDEAIDGSQATGWSTNAGRRRSTDGSNGFAAKHMVVQLDTAVDVTGLAVDPSSTCGDDPSSSTAGYTIEGSANEDGPWTSLADGTFTGADNGRMNELSASGSDIRFIKFTIISDQVPHFGSTCAGGGGPSGCHFVDLSELQVFGTTP